MYLWIQLQLRKVNLRVQLHITSLKLTVTWARCLCQALCLWLLSYDWQSGGTFRNWCYYNFPKGMYGQSKKCNTMFSEGPRVCMGSGGRIRCILMCSVYFCAPSQCLVKTVHFLLPPCGGLTH